MKGLWFSMYHGWIYVYFRSVLAGCHCIVFKDMTLIELHTINSCLIWFYLSQTSFHIHFVSNYPSYSLCLRPYIIFTLSQTIHHILFVSDHISYLLCFKLSIIFTLSQAKCHVYFVSNQLSYLLWNKPSYSLCLKPTIMFNLSRHGGTTIHSSVINQILYVLSHSSDKLNTLVTLRQREYDMYLRQSEYDSKYEPKSWLVRHQVNMKESMRQSEYDKDIFFYLTSLQCLIHSYSI